MNYFKPNDIEAAVKSSRVSYGLKCSIDNFLQDAALEIEKDMAEEGKERANLIMAKHFHEFVNDHQEDFELFAKFLAGYKSGYIYQCKHLYSVTQCLLMFHVPFAAKPKLIDLTAHSDWVLLDLEDDSVCRYVIENFIRYHNMKEKFLDKNGDAVSIEDLMYQKLLDLAKEKPYPLTSSRQTLRDMIYQATIADDLGV